MKGRLIGLGAAGAAFLLMAAPVLAAPGRPGMGTPQYLLQLSQQNQNNQNFGFLYNQFYQSFVTATPQQRQMVFNQVCNSDQTNQMIINHIRMDQNTNMQLFSQQVNTYTQMANMWDKQGRDTRQLRTDLDTLRQKIAQLGSDYDALVNQWMSVVNNGQQATPTPMQLQQWWNNVNNDLQDIRNFLGQNIQQDLFNVVNSQPTPTPTP